MTVLAPPLKSISAEARSYPAWLLDKGGTALALFAAAYMGHNDSIHFARNDMVATCVDTDGDKLDQMANLYPSDWTFDCCDAWEYAERAASRGRLWDVVSVDTFTGDATDRSLRSLDLWTSIAARAVTATITPQHEWEAPDGWSGFYFSRSNLAGWLVLQRD